MRFALLLCAFKKEGTGRAHIAAELAQRTKIAFVKRLSEWPKLLLFRAVDAARCARFARKNIFLIKI